MSAGHQLLSDTARDALGYVGGGVLALSLVPQIIKLVMTKSAEDISLMWSLLYFMGKQCKCSPAIPNDANWICSTYPYKAGSSFLPTCMRSCKHVQAVSNSNIPARAPQVYDLQLHMHVDFRLLSQAEESAHLLPTQLLAVLSLLLLQAPV